MPLERLQKILAAAGVASRRAAERFVAEGRVTVNGVPVTELGTKADPEHDDIRVDGRPLVAPNRHTYLALHKPAGVVTTASDERGRQTVLDILPQGVPRVFPVGRLDLDSEGLLLLTDDGDLALRLTHPRYGGLDRRRSITDRPDEHGRPDGRGRFEKEYLVLAEETLAQEALQRLRAGVVLDGRPTAPARVEPADPPAELLSDEKVRHRPRRDQGTAHSDAKQRMASGSQVSGAGPPVESRSAGTWYRVVLREGRNRQIRRMFAAEGVRVLRLVRVRVGPVRLGALPPATVRPLTAGELEALGVLDARLTLQRG